MRKDQSRSVDAQSASIDVVPASDRHRAQIPAAFFALLAVLPAGKWIIFLLGANSAAYILTYALSPVNPDRWFFVALAIVFLTSVVLCVAYVSPIARSKHGSLALLGASAAQSAAAIALFPWPEAGLYLLPLYWCFLCWRRS